MCDGGTLFPPGTLPVTIFLVFLFYASFLANSENKETSPSGGFSRSGGVAAQTARWSGIHRLTHLLCCNDGACPHGEEKRVRVSCVIGVKGAPQDVPGSSPEEVFAEPDSRCPLASQLMAWILLGKPQHERCFFLCFFFSL